MVYFDYIGGNYAWSSKCFFFMRMKQQKNGTETETFCEFVNIEVEKVEEKSVWFTCTVQHSQINQKHKDCTKLNARETFYILCFILLCCVLFCFGSVGITPK